MPVQHEIKSQLAKLLATEDLVVEHRTVETAQFNVHTRVLTLPTWEKASNVVYDMLVGHEVGHALFTPDQDLPKHIPHQFVNIVEDARIEKMMKRKYMGLAKTFFNGYKELNDEDFFGLEGEDISKMNLADRANLLFKIGNYVQIPIEHGEEMEIINMITDCETFSDVLIAAEELYNFCKKEKEQEKVDDIQMPPQKQGEQNQETQEGPKNDEGSSGVDSSNDEEKGENESSNNSNTTNIPSDDIDDEPEVRTVDNLEESLKDLVSNTSLDNIYVEIPKVNLDSVVIDNKNIHDTIDSNFSRQTKKLGNEIFQKVDEEYYKFKKSAQKEVNYLVKEFECKKAADSYARATTARTGVLDCSKLHTYKYSEDLFKKVSVIPDGKNHGLIFVLDWSGSMSTVLKDTCKQLFNLVWFCKKVSIPFDVYAFTNEWIRQTFDYDTNQYINPDIKPHYEKKEGLLAVSEHFSMMNILSSKVSSKSFDSQMLNIWRICCYYSNQWGTSYTIPDQMSLSGTPLNESLVSLHQIIPKFQKENKLQKVQCIILTDGEANALKRHCEVQRHWECEPYIGTRSIYPEKTFIRDRKLGRTYKVGYAWHEFTDLLLTNLKEKFSDVNFIGIRVLSSRDTNNFIKMYHPVGDELHKLQDEWKKTKSFNIKNSGYDAYFGLSSSVLSQDSEFDVKDNATKAQIKSAFVKSLKTKKLNKKVLGEFISLVV